MPGSFTTTSKKIMADLRMQVENACVNAAERALAQSNQAIDSNPGAEGLALGPGSKEMDLSASGYIATSKDNGYEQAKARADFGNDAKRGLWADPVEVTDPDKGVTVKVAYALARADLMHEGYFDPEAQKFMYGREFLKEAFNEEHHALFMKDVRQGLQYALGQVAVSREQRARERQAQQWLIDYNKETKGDLDDAIRAALERYGESTNVQKEGVKGISRSGREKRFTEQNDERLGRLTAAALHFMRGGDIGNIDNSAHDPVVRERIRIMLGIPKVRRSQKGRSARKRYEKEMELYRQMQEAQQQANQMKGEG